MARNSFSRFAPARPLVRRSCPTRLIRIDSALPGSAWGNSPNRLSGRGVHARAQTCQSLADQTRDLHLRDAYPLADLCLREIVAEAELQHDALALADLPHQRVQRGPFVGSGETVVIRAKTL